MHCDSVRCPRTCTLRRSDALLLPCPCPPSSSLVLALPHAQELTHNLRQAPATVDQRMPPGPLGDPPMLPPLSDGGPLLRRRELRRHATPPHRGTAPLHLLVQRATARTVCCCGLGPVRHSLCKGIAVEAVGGSPAWSSQCPVPSPRAGNWLSH